MAWTTPKTDWSTGELVAAADLNAIGDNLAALRQLSTVVSHTITRDITANVSQFTDIDSGNLNLTITTAGGDVLVHFHGTVQRNNHRTVYFDIDVDGTRLGGNDGILRTHIAHGDGHDIVSFTRLIQNLSAGSHTFKLQWKTSAEIKLYAEAQYWVREV